MDPPWPANPQRQPSKDVATNVALRISRRPCLWLFGLILLYWLTRLIALDGLAYFIDESNHLWWARWAWQGFPFQAASDGRLLNVLWMAVFWPFNAGVWISRVSVVLIATVGLASLASAARRLASARAAVLVLLCYTFMPLAFFFDRMALADSLSAPCVALAVWGTLRLFEPRPVFDRRSSLWAALGGLALTAAIFTKISNIIFLCLPLLAAVCLLPLVQWRRGVLLAGALYAFCLASLVPSALLVKVAGQSDLGLDILFRKTGAPASALAAQLLANFGVVGGQLAAYLPLPLWALVLLGLALALWKGGRPAWFLGTTLAVTLGVLMIRTDPAFLESRFLPAYAPLVALLGGLGLAALSGSRLGFGLAGAGLVASGLLFVVTGWTRAEALPLPPADRFQYIEGWPSGYGFRDAASDLIARGQSGALVTFDLGGFERFEAYLLGRTDRLTAEQLHTGLSWQARLLVVDTPKDDQQLAAKGWRLTELARYPRPGGRSALVVYSVTP